MDKAMIRKLITEELKNHMEDSMGNQLHEMLMSKKKPAVAVEIEMEKKMSPEELAKHEAMESPEKEKLEESMGDKDEAMAGKKEDDEDEVSDDEMQELMKQHGL